MQLVTAYFPVHSHLPQVTFSYIDSYLALFLESLILHKLYLASFVW